MTPTPTEIRLQLRALGYHPIPTEGKAPHILGWQSKFDTNDDEIRLWEHLYPYATNTGVLTRTTPLFDVDLLLKECGDAIEAMVHEFFEERGELLTRVGQAPKRGLVFRTDEPFGKIFVEFETPEDAPKQRLEFLCNGQQFIAYGVHPVTGQAYRWHARELSAVAREELPCLREADARELMERATAIALDFGYRLKSDGESTGNGSAQRKRKSTEPQTFFQRVNARALEHIEAWAKALFPKARYQKGTGAWRVSSKNLGRDLEEDLSIHPDGIWDYGAERPYTAIDLAREYESLALVPAALWLCERMSIDPTTLGYKLPPPPPQLPQNEQLLAELNRDNCVVLDGGRALVLRFERVEYSGGDETYTFDAPTFLRPNDFKTFYANRRVNISEDKSMPLGAWWLTHRQRRQYDGLVFKPAAPAIISGKLNLWRGWGVEANPGDWSLMKRHIKEVLCGGDGAVSAYVFKWHAWSVQHPDKPPEVAIGFLGERGTGKGTLGKAFCRIFGQHARHISSADHLTGHFNAHLRQCSFIFADEAFAPKDKAAEGALKRMITEPTLPIEAKGRDRIEVPNCTHLMIASNNDWVIPAGMHERRFVVQKVSESQRQKSEWFGPLYAELEHGGYGAMLFDLLKFNLGNWHPREIVRTAALAEQQLQSLSALDEWWLEILHTGVLVGADPDAPHQAVSNDYEEEIIEHSGYNKFTRVRRRKGLFDAARASSPRLRGVSDHAIGHFLKGKGAERAWPKRRRGWALPPLAQCRDDWVKSYPETEWRDEGVTDWQAEPGD